MDDPAPVRITFKQGSAAAVNRRYIGWFFAFAVLFAGAAFYRPAIQAFAVGFPIYRCCGSCGFGVRAVPVTF
jgi:hypothetical protein